MGVDAELIISSSDFGMAFPFWEDYDLQIDPYSSNVSQFLSRYPLPNWIKVWWDKGPHSLISLFALTKKYDLLHLHGTSPMYLQFSGKPFLIHEAGWIRDLSTLNTNIEKLGRRSYVKAECIVMTNPDTYEILSKLRYKRDVFIPFIIDPSKYRPKKLENSELRFFSPTRHIWKVKGNEKLIVAFSKFVASGIPVKMRFVEWGNPRDIVNSKKLIRKLNIENAVEWVPPYSKPKLIEVYNESDVVFDQFVLGSGGTIMHEAMACQVPVVIYLNDWNKRCYGEMPPIENAKTVDQIYKKMLLLTDSNVRSKVGKKGRAFIVKHNSPKVVGKQIIQIYEEILL
jgi:glycosyltransferase involved in cell wall biosynthesis